MKIKIPSEKSLLFLFLFQFKLIIKENHLQITILFTASPTTMKISRLEALHLPYFPHLYLSIFRSEHC